MADSSLARVRARAATLRAESARARERRAARHGTAADEYVSVTVDELGQLVRLEFAAAIADLGPTRWATSLLTVHRRACETVSEPPIDPADRRGLLTADRRSAELRRGPGESIGEPAPSGHPLAPEQQETRRATEVMVDRLAAFSADQGALRITGTADQVSLTFDGAMALLEANTTPAALQRGPVAVAAAVGHAWADAQRQLTAHIGLGAGTADAEGSR